MTIFVLEVPPGGSSAPQQHMFDEIFYVLEGSGSMVVELPDGTKQSFEWGPRSLFAPPLNCKYRIFNASGQKPARLASGNDLRIMMNILNNEKFFFDNPYPFPERNSPAGYYAGEGEMTSIRPGPASVGNQFRPRPRRFRTEGLGSARRRLVQHPVPAERKLDRRACLRNAGRHLQEGPPPRPRPACAVRPRQRL